MSYQSRKQIRTVMQYVFLGIEYWRHSENNYPAQENRSDEINLVVGKSYTEEEYHLAEEKLKACFLKEGSSVEIMNPFYQYGGTYQTVITTDIFQPHEKLETNLLDQERIPVWFEEVQTLLHKHTHRKDELFRFGGDVSQQNSDGVFFSRDAELNTLEKLIVQDVVYDHHERELMEMVVNGNRDAAKVLQWITKDDFLLDKIILMIEKRVFPEQQNILLRQLIPIAGLLSARQTSKLILALNEALISVGPMVRNKILSLFMKISSKELKLLSEECIRFIEVISTTKQMNCCFPAQEILKKMKSL